MSFIKLSKHHIPEEGKVKSIFIHNKEFCIVKNEGEIFVIDDECPHAGASLGMGKCQNDWIICPKHDIRFNFKTGKGQTDKFEVKSYPIKIENGEFYIVTD